MTLCNSEAKARIKRNMAQFRRYRRELNSYLDDVEDGIFPASAANELRAAYEFTIKEPRTHCSRFVEYFGAAMSALRTAYANAAQPAEQVEKAGSIKGTIAEVVNAEEVAA
jgi:hypothetical protein